MLSVEVYGDINVGENKVYGSHTEKIEKVFSAYARMDRNLGVLLSGEKGIGKTLFVRMLARRALDEGYPVIIVDTYYEGISQFLSKIDERVLILFDEFEKRFGRDNSTQGMNGNVNMGIGFGYHNSSEDLMSMLSHQTELLELFDGISTGKKLFVLTCNEIKTINSFLIDRPGRIHYHFRFLYPTPRDIMEYMRDIVRPEYHQEIQTVLNYSFFTKLSYDSLRAIAFEINSGLSTEEAVKDLNISRDIQSCPHFDVCMHFSSGYTTRGQNNSLNFFNDESATVTLIYRKNKAKHLPIQIQFLLRDLVFEENKYVFKLPADKIQAAYPADELLMGRIYENDIDVEDMLERDGLEYLLFNKVYF